MRDRRPCKDGRHDFMDTRFMQTMELLVCRDCPIRLTEADVRSVPPQTPLDGVIREKERDWYVNELES